MRRAAEPLPEFGELLNTEIKPKPVKHKPNGLDEDGVPLIDPELKLPNELLIRHWSITRPIVE
jgi:hypothetical protein